MAKDDALKDYVEVNVRIEQFWKRFPNGRIETEVFPDTSVTPNTVMTKAKVYRDITDHAPAATGHAYEVQGSSYINKTSFIENCYHRSTEVLTSAGWKNISDIEVHDEIGQVDLKTNELIFEKPIRLVSQENQTFLRIEDNLTCQIVTPEHFVIIDNKKVMAKDIAQRKWNKPATYNIKHDFVHQSLYETFSESDGFFKILQWIIADGYVDFEHQHIKFGFTKKRKFDRLIDLLEQEDCGYTTSYNPENGIRRINIKQIDSERFVKFLPGRKTLDLVTALSMNTNQAKAFVEEIEYTDGYCHKDGIYLRQTDSEYFDNLNLLAIKAGYSVASPAYDDECRSSAFPNAKPIFRARYKQNVRRTGVQISDLNNIDTAYCVETKTGTLVTRNQFKITVSSNCETSAVGRALAILGFEIRKSVASKEEVANARLQQTAPAPTPTQAPAPATEDGSISEAQIKMLVTMLSKSGYVKGDKALINSVLTPLLGYDIAELTDIKKADVQKVAEFLSTHKKSA